jgi:hypothetical protein
MRKRLIIILSIVFCYSPFAYTQSNVVENTQTGNSEINKSVEVLDETAKSNVRDYAKKLSRKYNVSEETADWVLKKVEMSPKDADMTLKVSQVANQPVEEVVKEYEANKGKGWGVIAKNLGIKPGSKEFHELKKGGMDLQDDTKDKKKERKGKGKKGKKK